MWWVAGEAAPLLPAVGEPDGWDRPVRQRAAHVLFTDGTWRYAQVTGWRRVRSRWYVRLAWRTGRRSWHVYDPRYVHPV